MSRLNIPILRALDRGEKIGVVGLLCAVILALLGPNIEVPLDWAIVLSIIIVIVSIIALSWTSIRSGSPKKVEKVQVTRTKASPGQQERYKKLAKYIFKPLSEYGIQLHAFRLDSSNELELDASRFGQIINSPYFPEARDHLGQDLPETMVDPEQLHNQIQRFNEDANQFLLTIIPHKTRQVFEKISNVAISEHLDNIHDNSVLLPHTLSNLRKYFISHGEDDPELFYENGRLTEGHNLVTLAIIPPELEQTVRGAIHNLKHDYGLTSVLDGTPIQSGIWKRRNDLLENGKILAKSIDDNILFAIDRKTYLTTCNECINL